MYQMKTTNMFSPCSAKRKASDKDLPVHFPLFPDGFRFGGFGVLVAPLKEHFDAPISSLAWAGSISCGLLSLLGPLIGGLINKFGLRPVCIGTFLNSN
jgi:hypothetical protein